MTPGAIQYNISIEDKELIESRKAVSDLIAPKISGIIEILNRQAF